jgi:DNA (cytosine-5)-methyltransferase 1
VSSVSEQAFEFVDLFAGIGGFHHALAALGGRCALAVEWDPECQAVYRGCFPETPLMGDIRGLTQHAGGAERDLDEVAALVPDHDVLCAGFPCQPFSKSGAQDGVRDTTRGTLFFDVMTIVLAKQPRFVILENVRNLAGPRHRHTWATIIDSLREAGYRVADEPVVLSPHLLAPELGGAPQVRDRVFILAHRVDRGDMEVRVGERLLERSPSPGWDPDRWRIDQHLDPEHGVDDAARYWLRAEEQGWIAAWQAFVQRIDDDWLPGFPIWVDAFRDTPEVPAGTPRWKRDFLVKNAAFYRQHRTVIDRWLREQWGPLRQRVREFPPSRRKFEWQARKAQPTRATRDLGGLVLHLRPSGIRVKPPTYLPALVAITQTSIIGRRMRRITPREAARLQGIPSDVFARAGVSDAAAYKQLGNAVNVGVARHAARALFEAGGAAWLDAAAPLRQVV